jgi:hypothetical protein
MRNGAGIRIMTEIQKARASAAYKANEAVKPLRAELAKSHASLRAARRSAAYLDAQCSKLWNDTYDNSLKAEIEVKEKKDKDADHEHWAKLRRGSQRFAQERLNDHFFTARHHPGF